MHLANTGDDWWRRDGWSWVLLAAAKTALTRTNPPISYHHCSAISSSFVFAFVFTIITRTNPPISYHHCAISLSSSSSPSSSPLWRDALTQTNPPITTAVQYHHHHHHHHHHHRRHHYHHEKMIMLLMMMTTMTA